MPSSKPAFFFSATQSVDDRLGDVFSFIWASYAGLRELWWQVRGFQAQFPELHTKDVEKKFLSGLPMPGGIDFQHLFIKTNWPEHEKEFSKWLLFEACTLYEGWAEKVCRDIFSVPIYEKYAKALQFPAGTTLKGQPTGYPIVVNAANSTPSPIMLTEFLPTLKASKLNCWATINQHLIAYRFFKECRNSFIHSDGFATQDVIDCHANVSTVQSTQPTPFRHMFAMPSQTLGKKIDFNLKDCILFATVMRKLICTFDAALCVSSSSELLLERRLRSLVATSTKWTSLPKDQARREQRVHRILAASRIPEPANFTNMMIWMQEKGII